EDVESFEPEFEVPSFRYSKALQHGGIHLVDSIHTQVAERGGQRSNVVVEGVGRFGVEGRRIEGRTVHLAAIHIERRAEIYIVARAGRTAVVPDDGRAGLARENAIEMPSTDQH